MKYSKNHRNQFFLGLKELVEMYFRESNHSMFGNYKILLKAIVLLLIYFLAYLNIFRSDNSFASLALSYIVIGLSGVMIVFNIVHDASHDALFETKKLNNYARYLGDIVGINTYIWDIRHNIQHHTFTNILGGDLIIEQVPLIRLSQHQQYKTYHRYQPYYAPILYMFYSFYWMMVIDFKLFQKKEICNLKNIKHPKTEWIKLIAFKLFYLFYILIVPWLFTSLSFLQVLGLFFIMHLAAGSLLSIVALLGHFVDGPSFPEPVNGLIDNSWSEHELEATIDFAPNSRVINWITGGLNTHVAHHLFPKICHIHYYKITSIIAQYCNHNGYPYKKESLLNAMISHLRYLKKCSKPK